MTRKSFKYILPTILAIAACSCNTNTVYHKYQPIGNNGWNRGDTLLFIISDSIETGTYNTEIGIRHTAGYQYMDLWLSVVSPNRQKADTIHIYLTNDKGNRNSNGSTGGYFQYSVPVYDLNYVSKNDSAVKISHIMNDNPLQGITDIGLKITRK